MYRVRIVVADKKGYLFNHDPRGLLDCTSTNATHDAMIELLKLMVVFSTISSAEKSSHRFIKAGNPD